MPFSVFGQSKTTLSEIRIRDPFILPHKSSGYYYMYAQMDNRIGKKDDVKGVEVYKSTDLVNWEGPVSVFEVPENFWAKNMVWAPEVHFYKNKYYLLVTFTSHDTLNFKVNPQRKIPPKYKRGTQILVANHPEGPFKPFANKPHTPENWMALDGTLYEEDGIPYMIFCHEWVQVHDGTMELLKLKADLSRKIGKPKTLFKTSEAKWAKSMKDLGMKYDGWVTDGPFLYKLQNGELLMIWSSFGLNKYAIGMALSSFGKIAGPWKQIDQPLFASNGGHGMVFKTFEGKLMLVFHQPNSSPEERARLFEIDERNGALILKD